MKRRKRDLPMAGILLLLSLGIAAGLFGYSLTPREGCRKREGAIIGENIAEPKELIIRNQLYKVN
ncbi:hypothetical protein LCGC14_0691350 [marine sediment metagenome]|uniref:Uncharacterized protein n=1 Tax=marine sediment metagenome TaxID=412755 RepID=A0A0F9R5N5_9ZZZZ